MRGLYERVCDGQREVLEKVGLIEPDFSCQLTRHLLNTHNLVQTGQGYSCTALIVFTLNIKTSL